VPKAKNDLPTLDLHGHRMEGLEDSVDRFITAAQKKNQDSIRIMTGKGSGQVKAAVQKYLKMGGYPFHFERTVSGVNEGVLIVSI
jgi:dsDNA-specific endonuclease/ATPase MutS2